MQNNRTAAENLLLAIQMYDFYMADLNLYLDTHPSDKATIEKYSMINEKRLAAVKTYSEKYGPYTADYSVNSQYFHWTDGPWPWERSEN